MSLLVMGVGVVTVATLFPIALLRSAQATKLTEGTIARLNAESLLRIRPNIVFDPDGDGNAAPHVDTNYIVDPMGWYKVTSALQDRFGNNNGTRLPGAPRRFKGVVNLDDAEASTILPDSWVENFKGIVTVPTAGLTATLTSTADLGDLDPTALDVRIILMDQDQRGSVVRTVTGITGNNDTSTADIVDWSGTVPAGTYEARIETQEHRYTWLATVRNQTSGIANIDIVVFFRRAYRDQDEQVHAVTSAPPNDIVFSGTMPPISKRNYIFDLDNARWYRVAGVDGNRVTLHRPLIENFQNAMVFGNVVDAYHIGDIVP